LRRITNRPIYLFFFIIIIIIIRVHALTVVGLNENFGPASRNLVHLPRASLHAPNARSRAPTLVRRPQAACRCYDLGWSGLWRHREVVNVSCAANGLDDYELDMCTDDAALPEISPFVISDRIKGHTVHGWWIFHCAIVDVVMPQNVRPTSDFLSSIVGRVGA
jgi:hypothetical protein